MAKALTVRRIAVNGDGTVDVGFSYGTPPLLSVETGGTRYESLDVLKQRLQVIEENLGEEGMLLLHLAITYLQANGQFGNTNQVTNKTITFDPYAPNPLRVT